MSARACRTGGSRNGNTLICAALMREVLPLAPKPDAKALDRARIALKSADHCRRVGAGAGGRRVRA